MSGKVRQRLSRVHGVTLYVAGRDPEIMGR
jgi:hypothetical protein